MAHFPTRTVTADEAVRLLCRLEPRVARGLTLRRFKYAAEATGTTGAGAGCTVMYSLADVALVRLLLRLEATGISRQVARFSTGYLAADVRRLISTNQARRVVVALLGATGGRYPVRVWPRLVSQVEARKQPGPHVALADVLAGLPEGFARICRAQPEVTQWQPVDRSTATYRVIERREEQAVER